MINLCSCIIYYQKNNYGRDSYILYEDILIDIIEQVSEDYYVIPSSISEVIIVPYSTIDAEYTKTMLSNVNSSIVAT